ncbi:MAG: hypothetical protein QF612_03370 [Candidatus Thalassarchaeaceae archaeon]|nr:hypothetical protein [Candidatus Thalassarchaeaceae archaeon]
MRFAVWLLVGVFVLPSVAGCLYNTEIDSCVDGRVRLNDECVVGEWVVIPIDFKSYDQYNVSEGDLVRLTFDPVSFGHYVPDTFHLEDYGISEQLSDEGIVQIDFLANRVGEFSYSSKGLCRVDIPGAGEVVVDCSIYCGETENGRSGVFSVNPFET